MSIVLDRLLGLSALFLIGLVSIITNFPLFQENTHLAPLFSSIIAISGGLLIFFIAALTKYKSGKDPIERVLKLNIPGATHLYRLYESVRLFQHRRGDILAGLFISLAIQLSGLLVFYYISSLILLDKAPPIGQLASIFPIGILTIALPLAPGGLGVGHVAFDQLFQIIGYSQGANIFNIFFISQLALNLTGLLPYLYIKSDGPSQAVKQSLMH